MAKVTLRAGKNRFETTGNDAQSYATIANPNPGAFGGVLRADMDLAGQATHPASFMCTTLGFCNLGEGLDEVAVGRGDSGGAAFTDDWQVLGVASFGQGSQASQKTSGDRTQVITNIVKYFKLL